MPVSTQPAFPPVRACIFDVDGLLIDSEDIYTEIYNNILYSYGKPDFPWTIKARQQSRGRQGTLRLLSWSQLPLSVEDFNAKVTAQSDLFTHSNPLPGIPELLQSLSRAPQIHIAVATSASKSRFTLKTAHLPAISLPFAGNPQVFGSDETMRSRAGKPAPDIFLLALERINESLGPGAERVGSGECLVFEDSIAGVEAGRRAGMRVVWVPQPGLREVCRGWEGSVLLGTTEGEGNGDGEGGEQGSLEETEAGGLRLEDGWAEMLVTLVDFPYERFGIDLNTSPLIGS